MRWALAEGGTEFIRRLMQHVCPAGFRRIRHYGLLTPAAKARRMATARALLAMPAANPAAAEAVDEFMQRVGGIDITRCPHCAIDRWLTIGCQAPLRSSRIVNSSGSGSGSGSGSNASDSSQCPPACRGPP